MGKINKGMFITITILIASFAGLSAGSLFNSELNETTILADCESDGCFDEDCTDPLDPSTCIETCLHSGGPTSCDYSGPSQCSTLMCPQVGM